MGILPTRIVTISWGKKNIDLLLEKMDSYWDSYWDEFHRDLTSSRHWNDALFMENHRQALAASFV